MYSREKLRHALTLYAVTDTALIGDRPLVQCVEEAIEGGITLLQLREKDLSQAAMVLRARTVMPLCKEAGIPFIVNDDVRVAQIVGADGVHLGQDDMTCAKARKRMGSDAIIGVTAHTLEQAIAAQEEGADYVGVGAIFPTSTKKNTVPVGMEGLKSICNALDIPVVAIGGLSLDNIECLRDSGFEGVAVVSALFAVEDIKKQAVALRALLKDVLGK